MINKSEPLANATATDPSSLMPVRYHFLNYNQTVPLGQFLAGFKSGKGEELLNHSEANGKAYGLRNFGVNHVE